VPQPKSTADGGAALVATVFTVGCGDAARDDLPGPFRQVDSCWPPLFVLSSVSAYPARIEWIRAGTRFGNRIRAFETDGVDRCELGPLALWFELLVIAPTASRWLRQPRRGTHS
jgi:hypothetical protein